METTSDSYRPFFNRRVAADIRQLIADRDQLVHQAAGIAWHHFAKPPLGATVSGARFPRRHFGDRPGPFPRVA